MKSQKVLLIQCIYFRILTFSVRHLNAIKSTVGRQWSKWHLNAIKSTAGRSFLGIKPLPALQQM
jgi:hypothetical protein